MQNTYVECTHFLVYAYNAHGYYHGVSSKFLA